MFFVWSCTERNKNIFINIAQVKEIRINEFKFLPDCNIMFDDIIWRGYETKEDFEKDKKEVQTGIYYSKIKI
jgi:hypothetical protein